MVTPLALAGGAIAGGSLVGSLLNRRRLPQIDTAPLNRIVEAGGQEQRGIIGRIQPETQQQLGQFRTDITGAQDKANEARRAAAQDFLGAVDPLTSQVIQQRSDQLKRQLFGQVPGTVQAAREAAAATGGLGRGSVATQLANIPTEAARQLGEGQSDIIQNAINTQLNARQRVFDTENQAILKNLGIDENTITTVLNTGNTALINELNSLLDEARNRQGSLLGIEQLRQTQGQAANLFQQQQRQQLLQALSGVGNTLLGAGLPSGVQPVPSNTTTLEQFLRANPIDINSAISGGRP